MSDRDYTKKVFDGAAEVYADKFMSVDDYSDGLNFLIEKNEIEEASVLDLACGPGNLSLYLKDREPKFKITGVDFSSNMLRYAKSIIPDGVFIEMDVLDAAGLEKQYDIILVGFVLPYLSITETDILFENIAELAKPGSLLYMSTIEGHYEESIPLRSSDKSIELMQYLYSEEFLERKLSAIGMQVSYIDKRRGMSGAHEVDEIIIVAQKNA